MPQESIAVLIDRLKEAKTSNECDRVLNQLAESGDVALQTVLSAGFSWEKYSKSQWERLVMMLIQKIDRPVNSVALGWLVATASDINSDVWEDALEMLIQVGEPAIPEIRAALRFYLESPADYSLEIQGLCTLLEKMGSPVIDPVLPELLDILRIQNGESALVVYASWPLQVINSPHADPAIPLIENILSNNPFDVTRLAFLDILKSFAKGTVLELKPVLLVLLNDPSDEVRTKSQAILDWL